MLAPRIAKPLNPPGWLQDYNRNVELAIQDAVTADAASSQSAGFTVTDLNGERVFLILVSGLTVTLPSAVGNTAKLTFKLMVPGTFTLAAKSGETIDGAATAMLGLQYEALTLFPAGSEWVVLMAYQPMSGVKDSLAAISESIDVASAQNRAALYYLSQIAALARGRSDPLPSDEPAALVAQFLNT